MGEVLVGKVCSGGLFEKVEVQEEAQWKAGTLRANIAVAVRRTAAIRELPITPRAWQIEMAAGMLERRDGLCITKTGDGKTFCFLVAAMYNPSLIFLVVSPLISLMNDQVRQTAYRFFLMPTKRTCSKELCLTRSRSERQRPLV